MYLNSYNAILIKNTKEATWVRTELINSHQEDSAGSGDTERYEYKYQKYQLTNMERNNFHGNTLL